MSLVGRPCSNFLQTFNLNISHQHLLSSLAESNDGMDYDLIGNLECTNQFIFEKRSKPPDVICNTGMDLLHHYHCPSIVTGL